MTSAWARKETANPVPAAQSMSFRREAELWSRSRADDVSICCDLQRCIAALRPIGVALGNGYAEVCGGLVGCAVVVHDARQTR